MHADNTNRLLDATRQRVEATRARAVEALERIGDGPVTVARLAATAGVSRSWIYTHPDLLERIHTLSNGRTTDTARPAAQRASVASLQRRLELAHDRVRQLAAENEQLRDELAHAYGRLRRST